MFEHMVLNQKDKLNDAVKSTTDVIDIFTPCTLIKIGALITVIADGVVTSAVTRRVITGSDVGASVVDSIIIPDTTAVGKIVYCDIEPTNLNPGDQLLFTHDAGGSSTAFQCFAVVVDRPETDANCTDLVESA